MKKGIFHQEAYLSDLEEIVNIDSGSSDIAGCGRVIRWFAQKYGQAGFDVSVNSNPGKHPMLEARHFARRDDTVDVLFIGHLDTVFLKGTCEKRPFSVEDGYAKGPGAADMKSGALLAFYIADALVKEGLDINICAVLNTDEEIGSVDSVSRLRQLAARSAYCFNFEGARPGGGFVKERKGVYDYRVSFQGIPAHAGIEPEKGASAIVEMARWIEAVTYLNAQERGTTLNTGIVKGGTASNVVAEYAEMTVELRYLSESEKARIERSFGDMAAYPKIPGVKTQWEIISGFPPMSPKESTESLMRVIEDTALKLGQRKPEFLFTGGGSDSNHLSDFKAAVMDGCGPESGLYHSDDEYMVIDSLLPRFELICQVIRNLF